MAAQMPVELVRPGKAAELPPHRSAPEPRRRQMQLHEGKDLEYRMAFRSEEEDDELLEDGLQKTPLLQPGRGGATKDGSALGPVVLRSSVP